MKKLSVLLASILLAMLSLCLFSGCNSNSIEGRYVFYSRTIYDTKIEKDSIVKGDVLEEYKVGDVGSDFTYTEDFLVINIYEDGRCDMLLKSQVKDNYLGWRMCFHWEETTQDYRINDIENWIEILDNVLTPTGEDKISWHCTESSTYRQLAYMDKGDLVLYNNIGSGIEEFRLKKVKKDKAEKQRDELVGVYMFSSMTATMDGETKTVTVGMPDEEGYAIEQIEMIVRLFGDGRACLMMDMLNIPNTWCTWRVEDGKVVIDCEKLQESFETQGEVMFTVDGDKLVYQAGKDNIIGSIVLKKPNLH